jgi:integrase
MATNTSYIYPSRDGYKFRLRIPKGIRVYFDDKREVIKSIVVSDYKKAVAIARVYIVEFEKLLVSLTLNHSDRAITKELVKKYYVDVLNNTRGYSNPVEAVRDVNYSFAIDNFVKYIGASEGMSDKNRDEMVRFFDEVIRYITKDLVLKLVDIDDLNHIKSKLRGMPKRTKQPYKSMTTAELLSVKLTDDNDKVSTTTLKKYLKWVRRFFKFAHASRYIDLDIAPFLESPQSELSAQMEREPFSVEEVSKSFDVIDKMIDDVNLNLIYRLLAYTGMRISEIPKATICQENNIYYIDLTEEVTTLKTKSSHRMIPLHKELILLDVHKKYDKIKSLFRDEFISKKFREKIKHLITDNPRKTLYSYRHTLATQLKYAEVNPLVISEILGHSHEGMTMGRYASRYPVAVLKEAIDKLEFS